MEKSANEPTTQEAAQAILNLWSHPLWKQVSGEFIRNSLRALDDQTLLSRPDVQHGIQQALEGNTIILSPRVNI